MPCTHVEHINALCMGALYGAKWFARNTTDIPLIVGCPENYVKRTLQLFTPKVRNGR